MKSFLRAVVVVLAGVILAACPVYAKKDKGGGPQIPPRRYCGSGESYG